VTHQAIIAVLQSAINIALWPVWVLALWALYHMGRTAWLFFTAEEED
jgi:hypothetical protein